MIVGKEVMGGLKQHFQKFKKQSIQISKLQNNVLNYLFRLGREQDVEERAKFAIATNIPNYSTMNLIKIFNCPTK